ncbi:MAG: alpha/beta hydrolase [Kaiparowitsia implicata GSE-PSE-MK54-09C]|jgi:L-proline amide hydrolase|nr:alpha/beta hydrolase [Kaiparowitsia implicata GSE-PSE-MK54-09C]
MTHDYLLDLADLGTDREVIFYDQIGNGRSSPVGTAAAAQVSLGSMVSELESLLAELTAETGYLIFAHSSGGCIALEHASRQPKGLKGLILANAFASGLAMQKGLQGRRDELGEKDRTALMAGPGPAPAYAEAFGAFFARYVCRVPPPPHLLHTLSALTAHPQIQHKLLGRDLFDWDGPLRHWSVTDRLDRIVVPTLAYGGRWDETGPQCLAALAAGLPDCEGTVFERSSHLPHIEETGPCLARIELFLARLG